MKRLLTTALLSFTFIMIGIVAVHDRAEATRNLVPIQLHLQLASCTGGNAHCAAASWTAPASDSAHDPATGYNIYRTLTTGGCATVTAAGCTKLNTSSISVTNYLDQPLAPGTTYFYVVTATNSGGESAPSAQASVTTGANAPNTPANFSVNAK